MQDLRGEEAFKQIFGWKTGHFEILPGRSDIASAPFSTPTRACCSIARKRSTSPTAAGAGGDGTPDAPRHEPHAPAAGRRARRGIAAAHLRAGQMRILGRGNPGGIRRLDPPGAAASFRRWARCSKPARLRSVEAAGSVRGVVLLAQNGRELMAGLDRKLNARLIRAAGKELATHLGKE